MKPPPAVLLDVTRLISRIGRGHPTGIDRVEAAWLGHIAPGLDNHLICRTRWGQLILPAAFGWRILNWLGLDRLGQAETGSALLPLSPRTEALAARIMRNPSRHAAQMIMLHHSKARAGKGRNALEYAIRRAKLADNTVYLNVGHSNLDAEFLANMPLPRAVLIHDVIPLDYPQWTRPSQVEAFARRFDTVMGYADLVFTVSEATADRVRHWREKRGHTRQVPIKAAHIGTSLARAQPVAAPQEPYFLALGTIEPRKNHMLLLDVWQELRPRPVLVIAGRRGWMNEKVFARLDQLSPADRIIEMPDLTDGQIATLLDGCHGLLFPSLAEGFGLPLTEAAQKGVPILCGNLASTKELLNTYPQYIAYQVRDWAVAVLSLAEQAPKRHKPVGVPEWQDHFVTVLGACV